jgi:L-fuculose-phosphate aldolase
MFAWLREASRFMSGFSREPEGALTTNDRPLIHPRDEIINTMERIYHHKMTTTSGGNLSIRDEADDIWITPARVDKGSLTRADVVCLRANGTVEGRHKPSSEHPFHQAIYRVRPDIRAVVHAHPVALVAFSICRETPATSLFPQAVHVCGAVGYAAYELPGSAQLGERIAEAFARGLNCVMLENHGVVIGGADLPEAFQRFETLEFTAKTIIKASQLGVIRYLTPEQIALAERPRGVLPAFEPLLATTVEKEIRRELCDFIHRGYRQRLLTSTGGSFSARLNSDSFLISSYGIDRRSIQPDELTLVERGHRESGKQPSRAVMIHQQIYQAHPHVKAIVNATPVNATAFSVGTEKLDARTIPESYLFLGEVPVVPFAAQFGDGREVLTVVSRRHPVALMENNGALILGSSILDAFDRLEVLECTAEALIKSRSIGKVRPMTDSQISELRSAFGMVEG